MDAVKKYYMTVFAQCFSPSGKHLAAANNYGQIGLFDISKCIDAEDNPQFETYRKPFYLFQAHSDSIYTLVSTENFLISGGSGEIHAWSWDSIFSRSAKISWSLNIPQGENLTKPEINSIVLAGKDSQQSIIAGCGNNHIYEWDIETQKPYKTLEGHQDYIHSLSLTSSGQELYSGSEDGSVKTWDLRKAGPAIHTLEPFKNEDLQRPRFGKWIGCVSLDSNDEWLICGGGPTLCIWHTRTFSPVTPLTHFTSPATVAMFYEDMVISAGVSPNIYHWSFNGELKADVRTAASSIYSVAINDNPQYKILSASGSSYKIEVCTNFMYRDFSLMF